jgi:hypothetical protein
MAVRSLAQSSLVEPFTTNSMLAGYSGNDFHHLETVRLSSSAASVTLSNFEKYSDFQHLQIRYVLKSSAGAADRLRLKVNNSNANLNRHLLIGNSSSVSSSYTGIDGDSLVVSDRLDGINYSPGVLDILDFYEPNKNKTFRLFHGFTTPGGDAPQVQLISVLYRTTPQITSLTFGAGNTGFQNSFVSGSRFSLYGLKSRA